MLLRSTCEWFQFPSFHVGHLEFAMKFAFLVHPLSEESKALVQLDDQGSLSTTWAGGDILEFCDFLHNTSTAGNDPAKMPPPQVRVIDELKGLRSLTGAECEGRLYEIPMDTMEILDDPVKAVTHMEQAVDMAAEWGAGIVGLGSMTGIVGGQGTFLAERGTVPITTGNSLTVYAAIENLRAACVEAEVDLSKETVAVVGIPGSIATAAARLLAPQVGELLLVARRTSSKATKLTKSLDAELILDIPEALKRARVVVSATSTGGCIEQSALYPGSIVVDIGVPADVDGSSAQRDDVLIISGGLGLVPDTMPRDSMWMAFHHGIVPSCLGETINLALEGRGENFSLGRDLCCDGINEIGAIAKKHGFDFSNLLSFGLALDDSRIAKYRKAIAQRGLITIRAPKSPKTNGVHASNGHTPGNGSRMRNGSTSNGNGYSNGASNGNGHHTKSRTNGFTTNGHAPSSNGNGNGHSEPTRCNEIEQMAERAKLLHGRYINPVFAALGGKNGFIKTFTKGEGNYLWDTEGKRYLDFVSGFGSMNVGHNHPRVVAAVTEAMTLQAPGYAQSAVNPYAAQLAEALIGLSPAGLELAFFANSGTESVEAALKLARLATGRSGFLHCDRSYHGKSLGALSVTGNRNYQQPFEPLLPGCEAIEYGDLEALERALSTKRHAAFIVEPLQGEGGMIRPPTGYLREAQSLCRATGTLLIVDEVQTGLGRTGRMFACEAEGIEPDIITLAKSLSGGLVPISAMLARREHWQKAYGTVNTFMLHTSTFGGGSLACAAALATLAVIQEEKLAENAAERGKQIREGLTRVQRNTDHVIADVRGDGLMIGLELYPLRDSIAAHWKKSDTTGMMQYLVPNLDDMVSGIPTMYLMNTLMKYHGIYSQVARSNPNVLRVQPPLSVTASEADRFVDAVHQTAKELSASSSLVDTIISKSIAGHGSDSAKNGVSGSALK